MARGVLARVRSPVVDCCRLHIRAYYDDGWSIRLSNIHAAVPHIYSASDHIAFVVAMEVLVAGDPGNAQFSAAAPRVLRSFHVRLLLQSDTPEGVVVVLRSHDRHLVAYLAMVMEAYAWIAMSLIRTAAGGIAVWRLEGSVSLSQRHRQLEVACCLSVLPEHGEYERCWRDWRADS